MSGSSLISLGEGVYTVPQICRILQPSMTSRKVHYWLDTGLLPVPIAWGSRGYPTLLGFQHLLQIRIAQQLRDELDFTLRRVRAAFEWIFSHLFAPDWMELRFTIGVDGHLVVMTASGESCVVPGGQGVLPLTLSELNRDIVETRTAWETRRFIIPSRPDLVSDARVQAGSPTVGGTRIETSFLAAFAEDGGYTDATLSELVDMYPHITHATIASALEFEGLALVS